MALFAAGQQSIIPQPSQAYPGDYYGVPGLAGSNLAATGFVAASDLLVGKFAWVVNGSSGNYVNTQATLLKGTNTIPVFVIRGNANVYPNSDINLGWSLTIPAQYQFEACRNGTFYAAVTSLNAGGVINIGDGVYVSTTTGDVVVSTAAAGAGYAVVPGFTVSHPSVDNPFGLNMVVITNVGGI